MKTYRYQAQHYLRWCKDGNYEPLFSVPRYWKWLKLEDKKHKLNSKYNLAIAAKKVIWDKLLKSGLSTIESTFHQTQLEKLHPGTYFNYKARKRKPQGTQKEYEIVEDGFSTLINNSRNELEKRAKLKALYSLRLVVDGWDVVKAQEQAILKYGGISACAISDTFARNAKKILGYQLYLYQFRRIKGCRSQKEIS